MSSLRLPFFHGHRRGSYILEALPEDSVKTQSCPDIRKLFENGPPRGRYHLPIFSYF